MNKRQLLKHWNKEEIVAMPDRHHVRLEEQLVSKHIKSGMRILDAGCGAGVSTVKYAKRKNVAIVAIDMCENMVKRAKVRLEGCDNVEVRCSDIDSFQDRAGFDLIISQRCVINFPSWGAQKTAIAKMVSLLRKEGKLLLVEGFTDEHSRLNEYRKLFGLGAIAIQKHNLFLDCGKVSRFLPSIGACVESKDGFGMYMFLTRCIKPLFSEPFGNMMFNKIATNSKFKWSYDVKCSRIHVWVVKRY